LGAGKKNNIVVSKHAKTAIGKNQKKKKQNSGSSKGRGAVNLSKENRPNELYRKRGVMKSLSLARGVRRSGRAGDPLKRIETAQKRNPLRDSEGKVAVLRGTAASQGKLRERRDDAETSSLAEIRDSRNCSWRGR